MALFPDATTLGAFAMVAVAASSAAQLGRGLHLPLISGYILAGAIAGPYMLGLLTHEQVHSMKLLINSAAMGFIGFSAGTKFLLTELRGSLKPVTRRLRPRGGGRPLARRCRPDQSCPQACLRPCASLSRTPEPPPLSAS